MKNKDRIKFLLGEGLSIQTVANLSESQLIVLSEKFKKNKKEETKEQVTKVTEPAKISYEIKGPGDLPNNPTGKGYKVEKKPDGTMKATPMETEMTEDTDSEMNWLMKGDTQDPVQKGPTGDGDPDSLQEYKNLAEKFESKKQQRYFFLKCGDGKTKEQKKWCKMAEEFADKTNFKKLPEKKKTEAKESGLNNLVNKVSAAYAGGVKNKLNSISPSVTFGENEIEKKIMKLVEKHITPKMTKQEFLNLVKEQGTKTAPSRPGVKPDVDTPTRPSKPATPYQPKPGVKPAPKAKTKVPSWLSFKSLGIKLK